MDLTVCLLFVVLSQIRVTNSEHVTGIITENMTFFYRKLPVTPSISANVEFTVSYLPHSMRDRYPVMGIYTAYPKININKRCSYMNYGQLHNENLHPILRISRYRTTSCELSGSNIVNCRGRVNIQDYIPRNFYLTFGFPCHWSHIYNLRGLRYNISFTKQSNETSSCIDYSTIPHARVCSRFYKETSLPNLVGDVRINHYTQYFKQSTFFEASVFWNGTCYQHIWEVVCYVILPKCDPMTKQVLHPCREMCWAAIEGCWKKSLDFLARMDSEFRYNNLFYVDILPSMDKLQIFNCDYLPSLYGSVPCFYKPVTCDPPPDVTDRVTILNASTKKDVYQLHDVIHYVCVNETFEMKGNSTITCLYSGEWSQTAPKCIQFKISLHPLLVVLPILTMSLIIYTSLTFCIWQKKSGRQILIRNRQYDAFVCYCYEGQDGDFAEKIIPQELEEEYNFQLCIHRRDFKAGWDIKWNIMNAIRNSNSAIIIMSQDYINSLWCVEEFEDCYMENMRDPAFKLFVILTQPADTLNITNEYIQSFFTKKTYLERDDTRLFQKIAGYLTWVKQPKGGKNIPEGNTEDSIDNNEDEMADNFGVEEHKENLKLQNWDNESVMDVSSEDSDDEIEIFYRQSDDESSDEFLGVGDLENNFENTRDHEYIATLVEVHHVDSG